MVSAGITDVWWIRHELKVAQEACCDAMVIDAKKSRRSYAETLLRVIHIPGPHQHSVPEVVSGMRGGQSLKRRFQMLANEHVTYRLPRGAWLMLSVLLIVASCYPILAQSSDEKKTEPSKKNPTLIDQNDNSNQTVHRKTKKASGKKAPSSTEIMEARIKPGLSINIETARDLLRDIFDDGSKTAPKIEADPQTGELIIRGTRQQIFSCRKLLLPGLHGIFRSGVLQKSSQKKNSSQKKTPQAKLNAELPPLEKEVLKEIRIVPKPHLDAHGTKAILKTMFDDGSKTAPQFTVQQSGSDTRNQQLVIQGNEQQLQSIQTVLASLDEISQMWALRNADKDQEIISQTVTLAPGIDPQMAIEFLRKTIPSEEYSRLKISVGPEGKKLIIQTSRKQMRKVNRLLSGLELFLQYDAHSPVRR